MSAKVTVLYDHPADVDRFERHDAERHRALVGAMPGLLRLETARCTTAADGSPAPFHRTADLWFASLSDVQAAFRSAAGRATAADLAELAPEGATVFISEVEGASPSPARH